MISVILLISEILIPSPSIFVLTLSNELLSIFIVDIRVDNCELLFCAIVSIDLVFPSTCFIDETILSISPPNLKKVPFISINSFD
ncbi:hypothetical protein D3C76_1699650 [compost metagenome]